MVSGGPRLVENGAICTTLEPGFQEARFTSAVTSRTALWQAGGRQAGHRLHRLRFHSAASGTDAPVGLRGGGQSGWRRLHRAGLSGEADPLPGTGTDDDPANFYPLIRYFQSPGALRRLSPQLSGEVRLYRRAAFAGPLPKNHGFELGRIAISGYNGLCTLWGWQESA